MKLNLKTVAIGAGVYFAVKAVVTKSQRSAANELAGATVMDDGWGAALQAAISTPFDWSAPKVPPAPFGGLLRSQDG